MQSTVRLGARGAEIFLGGVFLVGAVLKAMSLDQFAVQIAGYGVIENKALLPAIGLGTIGVEVALGMALVLGAPARALVYAVFFGMLAVFTGLILNGWVFHDLAECGCLGAIQMTPAMSISKNIVMMALGGFALWGLSGGGAMSTAGRGLGLKIGATAVLTALTVGYAWAGHDASALADDADEAQPGRFAQFQIETDQGFFDLGEGEFLVVMLSMNCEHCMGEVPALNDLVFMPDLPPLVAICLEENPGEMDQFRMLTDPFFPMHSIGDRVLLFFNLIGNAPPRLSYVVDGRAKHHWDDTMPDYGEILAVIETGGE